MLELLRHARIQAPLASLRSRLSGVWRFIWAAAGQYEPLSAAETTYIQGETISFKGDLPGGLSVHEQRRLSFATPRPIFEDVDNLIVTPLGGARKDGRLIERFSSCKPGLRMLAEPCRPAAERPEGYFIQSEHTDTFGDWMAEYLSPLSHLPAIDAPVYLPRAFADKSYVRRDAARTGINFVIVDEPICIRRARVVRQQRVIRYWRPKDVEALRRLLKAEPAPARSGSILYLSRHGEASNVADRSHPNLLIESVVKARGGRVIRSGEATLEDYLAASRDADTVLYDHGSAAYNMAYWRPRRVIEFVSDAWWMNSFLLFAYAAGVRDYTTILTDRRSDEDLRLMLEKTLNAPIDDTASGDG